MSVMGFKGRYRHKDYQRKWNVKNWHIYFNGEYQRFNDRQTLQDLMLDLELAGIVTHYEIVGNMLFLTDAR